jgi:aspartate aminotransferase
MMTTASSSPKIFADRIGRIEVSATMAVAAEAAKLRAQGANLVDFGAGEPHFPTPRHIKDAAIAAIEANFSRYTVVPGIPDVRKAIVDRHAADFGSDYAIDEAIFTTGGKLALFNAVQILVDHGDEVILPVPYWVSFKDIIQYAGGKVVFLETKEAENFRITADAIEKAITPKTKAIILNTPSNPSGSVVSAEDLERIVHLAHERGIFLLLDECYAYLNYAGKPVSGGSFTWAKEHIVILGSLSKTYAMTGWRAGFALAPKAVTANLSKLQSQSTSNATSFVQKAAVAALTSSQECVTEFRAEFIDLRDHMLAKVTARRRLLRLPQHQRLSGQGRHKNGDRAGHATAPRGPRRQCAGRGLRHRRAHSHLLPGEQAEYRRGDAPHGRIPGQTELVGPCNLRWRARRFAS